MQSQKDLIKDLKRALKHLDDPAYLETLSLAERVNLAAQGSALSRGQALCRFLRLAIDALAPSASSEAESLDSRGYEILYRYAICRESVSAIADRVGLSVRQSYRELHQGMNALARVVSGLMAEDGTPHQPGAGEPGISNQLDTEVQHLARAAKRDVDLGFLLSEAVSDLRPLALQMGTRILWLNEEASVHVSANRVMLRQALLNLLSHAIHHAGTHGLQLAIQRTDRHAHIRLTYETAGEPDLTDPRMPYAVATELLNSLGIDWSRRCTPEGVVHFGVAIDLAPERTLLVIDDNEDLIALFRRYLSGYPYRVYGATSCAQACDVLERVQPDTVILDVMMPDQDGWEVLSALRAMPLLRKTRIIVCSIINDPRLAAALGADGFINKPVTRACLLGALQQVLT